MRVNRQGRKYNPIRKICKICNKRLTSLKTRNVDGLPLYKSKCNKCIGKKSKVPLKTSIYIKKEYCENNDCTFIAIHSCQLDVDHIDGNSLNNNSNNLQTLCANCHRLKTQVNKDWLKKGRR